MVITLDYTALQAKVERSLSVIGKRTVDDKGELLFRDITVSTREKEIINDYFRQAVIDLAAELTAFISASTDTTITIDLPTNHSSALDTFITKSCEEYCVSYALASWFNVTAPRLTDKYTADCTRQSAALVRIIHDKRAPSSASSSPVDISTTVVTPNT
jgi:hypothetical protein